MQRAVRASFCDPAGKATNVQTAESEFEVFARAGLLPQGRSSSVRDGCVRIMDALAEEAQPLIVAARCLALIAALAQVKPHRTHTEIYDIDHELFAHPLDALRYLLLNLPGPGTYPYKAPEDSPGPCAGLYGRIW